MKLGINTYGLAPLLHADFDGTLRKLRALGYSSVEPLILFDKNISRIAKTLKHMNLRLWKLDEGIWSSSSGTTERIAFVRSLGFSVTALQAFDGASILLADGLDEAMDILSRNGLSYLVISPMLHSFEEAATLAPALDNAATILRKNGFYLVLHTHEHEFLRNSEGISQLDLYLSSAPQLRLELDVGWARFAGADPIRIMERYRDRIVLLHLKDIRDGEPRNSCFTAVGKGDLPLNDIIVASRTLPALDPDGIIVDQDKSNGDMLDDLTFCIKNLSPILSS